VQHARCREEAITWTVFSTSDSSVRARHMSSVSLMHINYVTCVSSSRTVLKWTNERDLWIMNIKCVTWLVPDWSDWSNAPGSLQSNVSITKCIFMSWICNGSDWRGWNFYSLWAGMNCFVQSQSHVQSHSNDKLGGDWRVCFFGKQHNTFFGVVHILTPCIVINWKKKRKVW